MCNDMPDSKFFRNFKGSVRTEIIHKDYIVHNTKWNFAKSFLESQRGIISWQNNNDHLIIQHAEIWSLTPQNIFIKTKLLTNLIICFYRCYFHAILKKD